MRWGGRKGESGLGRGGRAADVIMNHPVISCVLLQYLEEAEELRGEHLRDGRQFAPSDLVPLVAVGGERLCA